MSRQNEPADVLIDVAPASRPSNRHSKSSAINEYLDEYDEYYLENEKYIQAGQGGRQRTKKDKVQNEKHDPSGNVRIVTSKLHNFEHNRRKHAPM